jgi:outer membrane protein assembly factor BamB
MSRLPVVIAVLFACGSSLAVAGDWPMYRGDAERSGYTDESLPGKLTLKWSYQPLHPPAPAWPREERMEFDRAYHVAIAQGCVYFGSSADGKVYALDGASGAERWSFFTDAPVRFAPAVWRDRVFAVSDDGQLYCLNAADGTLIAKWRGGPDDARVLGNGAMVSKWPARGGPVIRDDILYWAAGIWQSEGVFLIAMDPATGQVLWKDSSAAQIEMPQPHGGANARSGVTAQGYLVATPEQLFVPTGRAVPAALARADGTFQYYRLQENGQRGGTGVMASGPFFYNGGFAFEAATGVASPAPIAGVVCRFAAGVIHGAKDQLRALEPVRREAPDRTGKPVLRLDHQLLWEVPSVPAGTALIAAGSTIVSAGAAKIATLDAASREILWTADVDDTAHGLAVADECLYVSTASGAIHCFAAASAIDPVVRRPQPAAVTADSSIAAAAEEIVRRSGVSEGYCVDLGCGNGDLALELARRTQLHIVAIDADPQQVALARRRLDQAGLYGVRVTVHLGDPKHTNYPKSFANLVVSQQSLADGPGGVDANELLRLQRPYGGVACLGKPGEMSVSVRGPLENAGQWTHLYADAANTLCSTDEIRGPLSVLWFRDVDLDLPQRHGRGPAPLFHDGRLFHEGLNALQAVDAYNGRPLWRFEKAGILQAYDADHLAGTAVTGGNFCVAGDSVFLRSESRCQRLDAATGKILATYTAPAAGDGQAANWGYLAYEDGVLYGSLANRQHIVRHGYLRADDEMQQQFSESSALFALDAETGNLLWRYDAAASIRHNAIAIGGGRVFLVDRPLAEGDLLVRAVPKGTKPAAPAPAHAPGTLFALDAKTGRQLWNVGQDVFGTMLIYSRPHDLLLMCYQATRFKLPSEVGGRLAVYRASSGQRLWAQEAKYETRPLLNAGTIIAYPSAVDLLTGESKPLDFVKSYGCGQLSGSKNLLLFRSATLGYYDFTRQAGTENYGGVRPGCWVNALPVGGLVLLPDASAGCKCSYQNRTWMALEGCRSR